MVVHVYDDSSMVGILMSSTIYFRIGVILNIYINKRVKGFSFSFILDLSFL